jgi:hypothetical protein
MVIKPIRRRIALASLMLALPLSTPALASNATNGYVTGFVQLNNGVILVFTSGARSSPPSCSNANFPTRWAFDGKTSTGQATLAILLSARSLHIPVSLYGTGTCSVLGDSETIDSIVTDNAQ